MHTNRPDPETLAALLDGRLDSANRERLLRQLEIAPDELESLLEAAAIEAELAKASGRDIAAAPHRTPRRAGMRFWAPLAFAAAALVTLIFVQRGAKLRDAERLSAFGAVDGELLASISPSSGNRLSESPGTTDSWAFPEWERTRGEGDSASVAVRALRMGVLAMDLTIAAQVADSATIRTTRIALERLAGQVAGGGAVIALLADLAPPPPSPTSVPNSIASIRAVSAAPAIFDLGAWGEVARISARQGRSAIFAPTSASRRALRRVIEESESSAASAGPSVAAVRSILAAAGAAADSGALQPEQLRELATSLHDALAAAK